MPRPSLLQFQVSVEEGGWPDEAVLEASSARILEHAAAFLAREEGQPFPEMMPELSLVFTSDADIRSINAEWRGQDKPTNVLSFPAFPVTPGSMPGPMLGDIVLAWETLVRESADLGKPFDDHLTHLLVHGFLHLFGYDHLETAEAERMEQLETRILSGLGISDPYGDSDPV
ncbi:rRNA maturation factor [Rhizobium sp. Leaf384]|uniref:rRNA maturation RNase YbeY n=1 Tax=unclassified Rhizobium TaxID=2613769 RepID=UPI0007139464|nr:MULTISPECIES: rRNA maturation RNase YbeY [unclassified Rhizobium]KQS81136.1 rRNA maturation factor [Rhizobium sp. Leaf384]KQS87044.1 rRNA maturation factor [Rhizobium sp. Leaf383]